MNNEEEQMMVQPRRQLVALFLSVLPVFGSVDLVRLSHQASISLLIRASSSFIRP
jgi:hypothetical protein